MVLFQGANQLTLGVTASIWLWDQCFPKPGAAGTVQILLVQSAAGAVLPTVNPLFVLFQGQENSLCWVIFPNPMCTEV